jgi:hypothetical protein
LHPRNSLEGRVELLGDDLPKGCRHAGAEFHFAAEDGDRPVRLTLSQESSCDAIGAALPDPTTTRPLDNRPPKRNPTTTIPACLRKSRRESSLIIGAALGWLSRTRGDRTLRGA